MLKAATARKSSTVAFLDQQLDAKVTIDSLYIRIILAATQYVLKAKIAISQLSLDARKDRMYSGVSILRGEPLAAMRRYERKMQLYTRSEDERRKVNSLGDVGQTRGLTE